MGNIQNCKIDWSGLVLSNNVGEISKYKLIGLRLPQSNQRHPASGVHLFPVLYDSDILAFFVCPGITTAIIQMAVERNFSGWLQRYR